MTDDEDFGTGDDLAPASGGGGQEPLATGATNPVMIWVRATAHLHGHQRGDIFEVDAADPNIQAGLEALWLIPVGDPDELPWGS